MIAAPRRPSLPYRDLPYRSLAAAPQGQVMISPSRGEIRRADPSLSFRVVAPGAQGFDVIVATDPALFDPGNAHRRTPKNFRSSRQDFQGQPIEIETGFYLLPRAFVRDLVSVDPKPSRLYYIAAAYDDAAMRQARYSVPPEALAEAPSVAIAADLAAANLSKVLGMAVERLGVVGAGGRVMAAGPLDPPLPEAIGGLPLDRRVRLQTPPDALPGPGIREPYRRPAASPMPAPPVQARPAPSPVAPPQTTAATAALPRGGFVDEDYAYGRPQTAAAPGFRDLDSGMGTRPFAYDDGFDDTDSAPAQSAPIPPLDPAPQFAEDVGTVTARPPAAADASEDLLVQTVLTEAFGGRYDMLSLDGGYRGRFGTTDPYYRRAHDGLRLGPHQAMQDSGELGELLALMQSADAAAFAQNFGPDAQGLLEMTNAAGPSGLELADGRSARVQPVGGGDLWEEPWVERFRNAARLQAFQAAMRGQIIARRLDPVQAIAAALGLDAGRGAAMLLAAAILRGVDGASGLLRAAVNPFDTPARLAAALDALGYADLGSFRGAQGLPPGDTVDDATHVALVAALRALGPDSPVQVPDGEAIMDSLVTAAGPGTLGDALLKLRLSPAFGPAGTGV